MQCGLGLAETIVRSPRGIGAVNPTVGTSPLSLCGGLTDSCKIPSLNSIATLLPKSYRRKTARAFLGDWIRALLTRDSPRFSREFSTIINRIFSRQANRIQTTSGPVQLHLDYIAAPERPARNPNAIAFNYNGFFFIGLTLDLVLSMFGISSILSRSSASADLLGLKLERKEERDLFLACLFLVQAQFVVDHELGYHFHGHTPKRVSSIFFSEFDGKEVVPGTARLRDQAHEVEADGYAVHMMLEGLFKGGSGLELVDKLQPQGISNDKFPVRFLLLCIGSYMFLRPQRSFDPARVREESHPFGLMRMNVVMVDLEDWAADHHPSLLPYVGQECFQEVMSTVVAAHSDSPSVREWNLQEEFLRHGDETYRDDLYAARALLRREMDGESWSLQ